MSTYIEYLYYNDIEEVHILYVNTLNNILINILNSKQGYGKRGRFVKTDQIADDHIVNHNIKLPFCSVIKRVLTIQEIELLRDEDDNHISSPNSNISYFVYEKIDDIINYGLKRTN